MKEKYACFTILAIPFIAWYFNVGGMIDNLCWKISGRDYNIIISINPKHDCKMSIEDKKLMGCELAKVMQKYIGKVKQ